MNKFVTQICELNCEKVGVCRIVQSLREPLMHKLKISDCSEFVQVV